MTESVESALGSDLESVDEESPTDAVEPFPRFYEREFAAMVSLAYAVSRSRTLADDIAQEAFLAAFRRWDSVGRLENPATWVRRVVINRSVSRVRSHMAAVKAFGRLAVRSESVVLPDVSAEAEHIWSEVARLPRRQRQVVALRYVQQLKLSEIGEALGCSKETANTHLRRAHETLSGRLDLEDLE